MMYQYICVVVLLPSLKWVWSNGIVLSAGPIQSDYYFVCDITHFEEQDDIHSGGMSSQPTPLVTFQQGYSQLTDNGMRQRGSLCGSNEFSESSNKLHITCALHYIHIKLVSYIIPLCHNSYKLPLPLCYASVHISP